MPVWAHLLVDAITILCLTFLMWKGAIAKELGIALLAGVIGAKLPPKGGGVATMIWPFIYFGVDLLGQKKIS